MAPVSSAFQCNDTKISCEILTSVGLWINIILLAKRLNLFEQLFEQMIGYIDWSELDYCLSTKLRSHGLISGQGKSAQRLTLNLTKLHLTGVTSVLSTIRP